MLMSVKIMYLFIFFFLFSSVVAEISYNLPGGWFRAGSNPSFYYMGVDSAVFYGNASGTSGFINFNPVYETNLTPDTFGTMMQAFIPQGFLNKRVQLTCFVKYTNVTDYAGMWMRVDTNTTQTLDNMSNRPLKGTGDWTKCVSVLDVHQDAVNLAFGVLLSNAGQVWFNQFEFTIVDNNTQTTSLYVGDLSQPLNTTGEINNPINLFGPNN